MWAREESNLHIPVSPTRLRSRNDRRERTPGDNSDELARRAHRSRLALRGGTDRAVASEADTAERERGHGDGCRNERGASRAAAPMISRAALEQQQSREHERHRGELGNGGVTRPVLQPAEEAR